MDIYANLKTAKILEIGSLNVNGSLRDHAQDCTGYVGVDMDAGPGVDIVVTPGEALPFENGSFDLVMASSVFEHDPAFWQTFVEMCRKTRNGGYVYVNAPSNGTFHRYPEDHWRFYPDSGMALARWAQSQGQDITLVESFVADRVAEVYNDFAAVFRKGPTHAPLGKTFVYQQVMCYNVRTWQSDELIHPRDATEDMVLIAGGQTERADLQLEIAARDARVAALELELSAAKEKMRETWTERCVIEQMLRAAEQKALLVDDRVSQAMRNSDKFEGLWEQARQETADLRKSMSEAEIRSARDAAELKLDAQGKQLRIDLLLTQLADSEHNTAVADERAKRLERENDALREEIASLLETEIKLREAEQALERERAEKAAVGRALAAAETTCTRERQHAAGLAWQVQWFRAVCQILLSPARGWSWPTPARLQYRRETALRHRQLFDAATYGRRNPDVAATRIDPLLHYILHGMAESREPI